MRLLPFVALGAFALALSTIGCSADAQDDASSASSDVTVKREVVATESDEGTTVQVTEGDTFVLKLGANATTGYQWKVTKTDRSFAYPFKSDYLAHDASGPVGAGGTQVFKWSTDPVSDAAGTPVISKVGKHQVVVEYRRPWESATAPAAKSYKITVDIVAQPTNEDPTESSCGTHGPCSHGTTCQFCWGAPACVPNGAMC
jgi:predicted secreted protein